MKEPSPVYQAGTYGYDLAFLKEKLNPVELANGEARLVVVPAYQGRVMTSSSDGLNGYSYGWINYSLVSSSEIVKNANPYGGEERIWLGPEGGQFSLYFSKESSEWTVPSPLDHEPFVIEAMNSKSIVLGKELELTNYSGTRFSAKITRKITLLDSMEIVKNLDTTLGGAVRVVAYESENRLRNTGSESWKKTGGTLSIWLLSMLKASPGTVAIIPLVNNTGQEICNDYFHNIPGSRLKTTTNALFFKADGEFKGKIGVRSSSTLPAVGSYNAEQKTFTLIEYTLPGDDAEYVNSALEKVQENPFDGDVVNCYNDGPTMNSAGIGNFYELETSSPAAFLKPGEEKIHTQRTYHFTGDEKDLDFLVRSFLKTSVGEIKKAFKNN